MSALDGLEAIAAPQTRLAALTLRGIAILAAIAAGGFLIWWIFIHPVSLRTEAAQSRAQGIIEQGGAKAATDAVKITVDVNQNKAAIDAITQRNSDAISHAQGAAAPIDPALARALHDALCLRDAYQHEPDCTALPPTGGSVGPVEPNAGGGTAAE